MIKLVNNDHCIECGEGHEQEHLPTMVLVHTIPKYMYTHPTLTCTHTHAHIHNWGVGRQEGLIRLRYERRVVVQRGKRRWAHTHQHS